MSIRVIQVKSHLNGGVFIGKGSNRVKSHLNGMSIGKGHRGKESLKVMYPQVRVTQVKGHFNGVSMGKVCVHSVT